MEHHDCAGARERLPDLASGALAPDERAAVERHLATGAECAAELEVVRWLRAARPHPSGALAARVTRALVEERRPPARAWWGLTAAAVAALALGIGIASEPGPQRVEAPAFATDVGESGLWLSDDGLVAGAPLLEGLSDQALGELLDELSAPDAAGGAV